MNTRTDYSRQIDWSAVKGNAAQQCQNQILRRLFVCHQPQDLIGLHGWLRGTPRTFIEEQLDVLQDIGVISRKRHGDHAPRWAIVSKEQYTSAPEVGISDIRAEPTR